MPLGSAAAPASSTRAVGTVDDAAGSTAEPSGRVDEGGGALVDVLLDGSVVVVPAMVVVGAEEVVDVGSIVVVEVVELDVVVLDVVVGGSVVVLDVDVVEEVVDEVEVGVVEELVVVAAVCSILRASVDPSPAAMRAQSVVAPTCVGSSRWL